MSKKDFLIDVEVGDIVEAFWLDAFWVPHNSYRMAWDNDSKQYTFGVVVSIDHGLMRIAHEFDAEGTFRGLTNLPLHYIKSLVVYGKTSTRLPE